MSGIKMFRDPVHDMIAFHRGGDSETNDPSEWGDALLLELIDTEEMQRLRRIRQLGPASLVYPCAEHSRFSHALGVAHLTKRILRALLKQQPDLINRRSIPLIKAAALLHDVGHGPYSHVFEQILPSSNNHETWSWRIITGNTQVANVLERYAARTGILREELHRQLGGVLGHREPDADLRLGRQIISSQLDADRMDYLLRDAHFSGVAYGRFDLEWLLRSLRARKVNRSWTLCVDIGKGPTALESYLSARDHMYRQVYDHKTVRAFEALLTHIFGALIWFFETEHRLPNDTPSAILGYLLPVLNRSETPELRHFLELDDALLDYAIQNWSVIFSHATPARRELARKCRMFRHRQPVYRRVRWLPDNAQPGTHSPGPDLLSDTETVMRLQLFLAKHSSSMIEVSEPPTLHPIQAPLGLLTHLDRVIRTPYTKPDGDKSNIGSIHVLNAAGVTQLAENASPLVRFLGQQERHSVRLFVDPHAEKSVIGYLRKHLKLPSITPQEP
ncbi:MAG: HD domain-containing protein [Magnetococcales bacterium]|nr:HD domain-containing protein [Magnetococcales bacterium]